MIRFHGSALLPHDYPIIISDLQPNPEFEKRQDNHPAHSYFNATQFL